MASLKDTCFDLLTRSYLRLFARTWCYPWNKLLFNLSLRGLGILSEEPGRVISAGEARLLRTLAAQWGPSPTILDVGAHHGEYARLVKRLAPQATVYAFEPHPRAFAVLQEQTARDGVVAVNRGCGDATGSADLYDHAGQGGSVHATVYAEVITSLHRGRPEPVRAPFIVLDEFIRERGINRVALLKIDTEGHELRVLLGLRETLAKNLIDAVQFEFNAMNVMSRVFCRDFYAALPNYDFYRLLPGGPVPLGEYRPVFCEIFAYQNIVAIRRGCGLTL
jgi:FkbM family methyltransferase